MANAVKGELDFAADGESYTLVLDLNALCEAEPFAPGIMDGANLSSFRAIRAVFWAGLQRKHEGINQVDAGDIIQTIGLKEAGRLIGEGMKLAFNGGGGEGAARPQKGRVSRGTGAAS